MNQPAAVIDISRLKQHSRGTGQSVKADAVTIGKDILELLSTSMYVDPMTIYREYVQNAADAIDAARASGLLDGNELGRIDIRVDAGLRAITIRDNGTGIAKADFLARMCSLGASTKRGTAARGFRGVGRLAGLGYCQEVIFRSHAPGDVATSEIRWDCRKLKIALRSLESNYHLAEVVHSIVEVAEIPSKERGAHFFEVELKGIVRHGNDRLLNPQAVSDYLAQVAPIPFAPEFRYGAEIEAFLRPYVSLGNVHIHINGAEAPLYRPHRDQIQIGEDKFDDIAEISFQIVEGSEGDPAALVWILHHGYTGALPKSALVKGLRQRAGNVQVGEADLLEQQFPEQRFNAWSIGEIHMVDRRIVPNGRRDHFEQNTHYDNICNAIAPIARDIARRCRHSSMARKWLRDFDIHRAAALENARAVGTGVMSAAARQSQAKAAAKSLTGMWKIANTDKLPFDVTSGLQTKAKQTEVKVKKLLGETGDLPDPFAAAKPEVRDAYQRILSMIFECSQNRSAANSLVDKIVSRLQAEQLTGAAKARRSPSKKTK